MKPDKSSKNANKDQNFSNSEMKDPREGKDSLQFSEYGVWEVRYFQMVAIDSIVGALEIAYSLPHQLFISQLFVRVYYF